MMKLSPFDILLFQLSTTEKEYSVVESAPTDLTIGCLTLVFNHADADFSRKLIWILFY